MISADTKLGAKLANKALTYTGYDSALLELNSIVQTVLMHDVSCTFGLFSSPNSPVVSNEAVIGLVDRYKVLMPVHHASILTMLNVNNKIKDKRSSFLVQQYDRLSF